MNYLCILISILYTVLADQEAISHFQEDGPVYSFLESLRKEEWDLKDKPCLDATLEMLNGVKNSTLWATWIWDSMQRSTGFLYGSRYQLGSFDQCMKLPWLNTHPHLRTQYCLADVTLNNITQKKLKEVDPNDNTQLYINTASKYRRHFNLLTWGLCFSSRCSTNTITKLVHVMLRTQHLPHATIKEIKVHSCQIAGDTKEYGFGFKIFMWMILFLVIVTLLATRYSNQMNSDKLLTKLARSFCLKRNWRSLMKTGKDNMTVLDVMKFTSAMIVVLMHYISYSINFASNRLDIETHIENKLKSKLLHLDIVVDTFLVISGLLLIQSIVRHKRSGKSELIRMLLLRYVRLIGPQTLMVFYVACVSAHISDGPLWPYLSNRESEDCAKNWWTNLFFINNYVNTSNMCYPVTWYNSCDYQLAVLGTIFYCIYQKNKRFVLTCMMISFLLLVPLPALITYWNKLPPIVFVINENMNNWKENPVFHDSYIQTHNRALVYVIGMVLGHFMSIYNPADYRKIINKKWSICGALASLFLMERILSLGAGMLRQEYNPLETAAFVAVNRIIWALAICGLIVVCEYGTVPAMSDNFNLQFMLMMGRLSYGVYIVHMALVYRLVNTIRSPLVYDLMHMITGSFGILTISYLISLLIWHFVEVPLTNIASVLLDTVSRNKTTGSKTKKELEENEASELTKSKARVKEE